MCVRVVCCLSHETLTCTCNVPLSPSLSEFTPTTSDPTLGQCPTCPHCWQGPVTRMSLATTRRAMLRTQPLARYGGQSCLVTSSHKQPCLTLPPIPCVPHTRQGGKGAGAAWLTFEGACNLFAPPEDAGAEEGGGEGGTEGDAKEGDAAEAAAAGSGGQGSAPAAEIPRDRARLVLAAEERKRAEEAAGWLDARLKVTERCPCVFVCLCGRSNAMPCGRSRCWMLL